MDRSASSDLLGIFLESDLWGYLSETLPAKVHSIPSDKSPLASASLAPDLSSEGLLLNFCFGHYSNTSTEKVLETHSWASPLVIL